MKLWKKQKHGTGCEGRKQKPLQVESSADIKDLETLLDAALRYESGFTLDGEDLRLLYQSGSSPGGARPKALCRKETGSLWIAKFPRHNDALPVESIEAATLDLAKRSGLMIPEFKLLYIGSRKALLVKRFDISDHGERYHMISMQTLLQAQGYYFLSYNDMFEVVKAHSYKPSKDISYWSDRLPSPSPAKSGVYLLLIILTFIIK